MTISPIRPIVVAVCALVLTVGSLSASAQVLPLLAPATDALEQGSYREGIDALKAGEAAVAPVQRVTRLRSLAVLQQHAGLNKEAGETLAAALKLAGDDNEQRAHVQIELAWLAANLCDGAAFDSAIAEATTLIDRLKKPAALVEAVQLCRARHAWLRGEHRIGAEHAEAVWNSRKTQHGETDPRTLEAAFVLIAHLNWDYQTPRSLKLAAETLEKARTHKADALLIARATGLLGEAQHMHGRVAAALDTLDEAEKLFRAAERTRHPDYLALLRSRTDLHSYCGDTKREAAATEASLAHVEAWVGKEHPWYADVLIDKAWTMQLADEDETAGVKLIQQAIGIYEKAYGQPHVDTARGYAALYSNTWENEALQRTAGEKAIKLFNDAAPNHIDKAWMLVDLAWDAEMNGDILRSQGYIGQALTLTKTANGEAHANYAWMLDAMAGLMEERGMTDGAITMRKKALEIIEKGIGPDSLDAAWMRSALAWSLTERGAAAEALTHAVAAVELERKLLPADSPTLTDSLDTLAAALEANDKHEDAAKVRSEIARIEKLHGIEPDAFD